MKINYDSLEEVKIILPDRKLRIKIEIDIEESVESFKRKIEHILTINFENEYDIYIRSYIISDFFDYMSLRDLLKAFDSTEIEINSKILISLKKDIKNGSQEIGVYTEFNSALISCKSHLDLQRFLNEKKQLSNNLDKSEKRLSLTLENLEMLRNSIKVRHDSIIIPKKHRYKSDTLSLNSLQNKNSDELSEDTEDSNNSKESLFKKNIIEKFSAIHKRKETILKDRTDTLLLYKQLEKTSYKICKENENLAVGLDEIEKISEGRKYLIEKLTYKEERLFNKLSKESQLLYKYMSDKNKMDPNYYFQSLKLNYCRIRKYKRILKLVDEKRLIVFEINSVKPKESELLYRSFKDLSQFGKYYTEIEKRNELQLNLRKHMIVVLNTDSFIYNFKSNEMRILTSSQLTDVHVNGNLLYVPYDNSIYCILGRNSTLIEKLKLPNLKKSFHNLNESWTTVCTLDYPRAYFCSFIVNKKIIYNIFGYCHIRNEHCIDFQKIDISLPTPIYTTMKLNDIHIPKLTLSSCIKIMENSVYIFGGMYREKNPYIFIFDTNNYTLTKCDFILKTNYELTDSINFNVNLKTTSANFMQEVNFIPVKFNLNYEENAFYYCLFDTSGFIHMLNVKNFKHFMICQEDKNEIWDESHSSGEEDIESKSKKSTVSNNDIIQLSKQNKTKETWNSGQDSKYVYSEDENKSLFKDKGVEDEEIGYKKSWKTSQISKLSKLSVNTNPDYPEGDPDISKHSSYEEKHKIISLQDNLIGSPIKEIYNNNFINVCNFNNMNNYSSKNNFDSINSNLSVEDEGEIGISFHK